MKTWALAIVLATSATAGCSTTPAGTDVRPESTVAPATYRQVNGVLRTMPEAAGAATVFVEIEDVPGFVGPTGSPDSIAMLTLPFRVDAAAARGLNIGDRITFDFELDWDADIPGRIIRLSPFKQTLGSRSAS